VNLVDVQSDGGIHAPSLRCHNDKFYLITTNVYSPTEPGKDTQMVNFVLTADDPAGPWSMPNVIEGAPGIDPDLFFDDDGSVWYVGNHGPADASYPGEGEIWLQRVDPSSWELIGERHFLWRGALKRAIWAEGPHIYKHDGRYYLLVAEGGTSFNHAVTIAVSDSLTGPYEGNERNPILTSRHLSYDNWVNSTGHADLVELEDGRWYMVALGIRGDEERRSNMGRETHLIEVEWEREPYWWKEKKYLWPVAAPSTGRVERTNPLPFTDNQHPPSLTFRDDFEQNELELAWTFRRVPEEDAYSLISRPGFLRLYSQSTTPAARGRVSQLGIKQTESDFLFTARTHFESQATHSEAGITLFQKDDHYLNAVVKRQENGYELNITLANRGAPSILTSKAVPEYAGIIEWQLESTEKQYELRYRFTAESEWSLLLKMPSNKLLSQYYTGAHVGFYASSNGIPSADYMDIDWADYRAKPRP
jgi:alpha-N-arabinofuranosidase